MGFLSKFLPKKEEKAITEITGQKTGVKEIGKALERVLDPETGVNIVDLGLIYDISLNEGNVIIKMTMTTPSCPVVGLLVDMAKENAEILPGIISVEIELIWQPRWSVAMMSEMAKKQLGW
jgi:metal-sulfur cluster biosynthetic enzyme